MFFVPMIVLLKTMFMFFVLMIVLLNKNFYHNKAMFTLALSNINNPKFILQNNDSFIKSKVCLTKSKDNSLYQYI